MRKNSNNWNRTFLLSFALVSAYVVVNAATPRTLNLAPSTQESARRDPTGTGVEPAVPDIGNSKTAPGIPAAVPENKDSDVSGVVQSVDRGGATSRIRIKDADGGVRDVAIDKKTSILRNEQETSLSKIKAGDRVVVKRNGR